MAIDIDEGKVNRNEVGLWFGWTIATGLGMLIGFLPANLVSEWLGLGLAQIITPLLSGALIGFGQWLILRNFLTDSSDWVLAAGAGWSIGYALAIYTLQFLPGGVWMGLIGYILFGVIIALIQWPILRREIPQIIPWIVANAVGWTLGLTLGQFAAATIVNLYRVPVWVSPLLSLSVSGLIAGAAVGLILVWIVRKPERTFSPNG